jgi:hypothetical protein
MGTENKNRKFQKLKIPRFLGGKLLKDSKIELKAIESLSYPIFAIAILSE